MMNCVCALLKGQDSMKSLCYSYYHLSFGRIPANCMWPAFTPIICSREVTWVHVKWQIERGLEGPRAGGQWAWHPTLESSSLQDARWRAPPFLQDWWRSAEVCSLPLKLFNFSGTIDKYVSIHTAYGFTLATVTDFYGTDGVALWRDL